MAVAELDVTVRQPPAPIKRDRERAAKIAESISEAIEFLSIQEASLAHMVLGNAHVPSPDEMDKIARAYTNGKRCFYSSEFASWTIQERCGVIVHEWAHCGLDHARRFKTCYNEDVSQIKDNPFGQHALQKVFNGAADLVINSWLQASPSYGRSFKLPEDVITVATFPKEKFPALWDRAKRLGHHSLDVKAVCDMTSEQVYRDIITDSRAGIEEGLKKLLEKIADLIDDGETGEGADAVDQGAATVQFVRMCSQMAGSDRSGMLRRLADAFPRPAVNWRTALRKYNGKYLGQNRERTWTRRDRRSVSRDAVEKGMSRERIPKAILILDTSGSMPDDLLAQILTEGMMAARTYGAEVIVRAADVATASRHIIRPSDTAQKILQLTPKGGGGTDFEGPLREAEAEHPDVVIYGTDMYGNLDFKPRVPVVWLTRTRNVRPAYGHVIILPSD